VTLDPLSGLPPGLRTRPATLADAGAVLELAQACEVDDHGFADLGLEEILAVWRRPSTDLATNSVLVFEGERLVGDAELYGLRAEGLVHPEARGRGIGSALLAWTEHRAVAAAPLGSEVVLGQAVADANATAVELLTKSGYDATWDAWTLEIAVGPETPSASAPDGVTVRPMRFPEEARAVYEVIEGSFAEWPMHVGEPFEDWSADTIERGDFDPSLVLVAEEDGNVVGVALSIPGEPLWLHQLAVRRDRRGRGIGECLLRATFSEAAARGRRAVGLSTDSRSGALTLYLRVGMHVTRTYRRFVKRLR
jgi:GNAT superfamily N-acetyltransferase